YQKEDPLHCCYWQNIESPRNFRNIAVIQKSRGHDSSNHQHDRHRKKCDAVADEKFPIYPNLRPAPAAATQRPPYDSERHPLPKKNPRVEQPPIASARITTCRAIRVERDDQRVKRWVNNQRHEQRDNNTGIEATRTRWVSLYVRCRRSGT